MDWKQEAIEKLRQYQAKHAALQAIPEDIRILEDAVMDVRSTCTDRVRVRNSGTKTEDILIGNIAKREELKIALAQAQCWVARVDRGLAALNEEERLILEYLYIAPVKGNLDRLCERLCVEQASVYRKRDKALRRFTLALYGCMES